MSDEATTDKPAKAAKKPKEKPKGEKSPGMVARLTSLPKQITAAGCASCLTSLFLIVLIVTAWVFFLIDPANIPWRHSMSWWRITLEVLLAIAIPLVLYRAIKLWLEGDKSDFPEIDFAWKAGLDALAQNGLNINSAPLFLVLGAPTVRQQKSLVRAASLGVRVRDVPDGPAALHWYAGPDGIYLFLTETSGTSALAALLEKRRAEAGPPGDLGPSGIMAAPAIKRTAVATPAIAAQPAPTGGNRGTIMLDQFVADMQSQADAQAASSQTETAEEPERESAAPSAAPATSDQPAILSQRDAAKQLERLEYVCHLLKQARHPLCPTNGVLVLLPFEIFQASARETQQLQRTVRSDLGCLQRELEIRCPVTALVVGMHEERGFRELVRRVGRERALAQRFGRRFDVRMIPNAEPMGALCAQLAGVFEDWIHTLFREAEALTRPGNQRLYGLLCKIRCTLAGVLNEVLVGGFGHVPQDKELREPIPFSGCYFAATGETDDQQAFVRGVFEKLVEEQEDVEWTRRALNDNQAFQVFSLVGIVGCLGLLAAVVALVIYRNVT
ncbi:MAG: type VI secretion protein IcmF/TssM N-terminal domain-containing protein [Pirellulaceae bacterium]|nr:type VI secretion protein IcmF/TssM N-terminal domain-containing protein [Pirellulaceae bacterium]